MTIAAWAVLAFFILAYLPRGAAIVGAKRQDGQYDINNPRAQQARLEGSAAKAQAAHQNALEAFAPFAAAVWAAHYFDANGAIRDGLALAFLGFRALYWYAYLNDWGYGRSAIWVGGVLCTIGLFIAAGT